MAVAAIETHQLTRDFPTTRAVDDLSIRVEPGTVFGFLGPNGSGKTTTIRLLLGLIPPSSGSATVLGYDSSSGGEQIRSRTGALLEHPGLYERLTAEENLEFFARIWRLSREERDRRIKTLLDHMGLWERRGERVGGWSRGMRQKLAIARALLHHPPLVFLDEPTAGLDPVASAALRRDVAHLARAEGVTVFLTTHNLAEAEKICDSVAVIYQGRLIAAGKTEDLLAHSGAQRLTISTGGSAGHVVREIQALPGVLFSQEIDGKLAIELDEHAEPGEIIAELVRRGVVVQEVRREHGTLEDAFLALVTERHAG